MANTSKGGKKASSAPKSRKKTAAKTPAQTSPEAKPIRREVGGLVLLFLAAIVVVSFFDKGGFFGYVKSGFMALIGYGYWIAPLSLGLAGFILVFHRGLPVKFRVFSALILPVLLAGTINIYTYTYNSANLFPSILEDLWRSGMEGRSGGVLGGFPSWLLVKWLHDFLPTIIYLVLILFFAIKAINFLPSRPSISTYPTLTPRSRSAPACLMTRRTMSRKSLPWRRRLRLRKSAAPAPRT